MPDLFKVKTLIDNAAKVVGSKSQLARELGVAPQRINDWFSGMASCSPEDRARIASFAREDPLKELIHAVIEKHTGTLRGEQLRIALNPQNSLF